MKDALSAAGWWALTIGLLVLIDDLTYGPIFWALAVLTGQVAVVVAFSLYLAVQLYLVKEGTETAPSRPAAAILRRLRLARRSEEVGRRELQVHERVTGGIAAVVMAPLIGGVLPVLLLWKRGWSRNHVMLLSVLTSTIYAAEFAFLHAYLPSRVA